MNKKIIIGLIIVIVIIVAYRFYANLYNQSKENSLIETGFVVGHIAIGPICPVEREGGPCPIPPEVYSSREVIIYKTDGKTILKRSRLDSEGNYKIELEHGNYWVQINPAGIGAGEKKKVNIKQSQTTVVNFDIDTGIR